MQLLISSMSFIMSLLFTQMNHPLAMGLMLLIQTLIICIITGLINKTFWFSYILFLIFLGGMLILFIYMTSLASNEMFSFSSNLIILTLMMLSLFMMIIILMDNLLWIPNFLNFDSYLTSANSFLMTNENSLNLTKLYNQPTGYMTLLLVNYLFLTLIAIVKITNIFYGPLRQKN